MQWHLKTLDIRQQKQNKKVLSNDQQALIPYTKSYVYIPVIHDPAYTHTHHYDEFLL